MPKTIAICNQKGGVGKTTTAINLGALLAQSGIRVLLVDLDPQGNATGGLGLNKKSLTLSIYKILLGEESLERGVVATKVENLWLVPSHVDLSGAEAELIPLSGREERLKLALLPVKSSYDLILIDCPPALGLLTVNALTAADAVLIPLQCEYYALEGLSQLLETIRLVREGLNPFLETQGILLTMADFRTKLTNDVILEVRNFFGSSVYDVVIPRSVRLSEAPSHGLPISLYDPNSAGAQAYRLLAQKMMEEIHAPNTWVGQRNQGPDSGGESRSETGRSDPAPSSGNQAWSVPTST